MAPQKKAIFNSAWLLDEKFSSWIKKDDNNPNAAYCKFCMKSFSLSNMGRQALLSHASGNKHKSKEINQMNSMKLDVSVSRKNLTENLNSTGNCLLQSQQSKTINNTTNSSNNDKTILDNNNDNNKSQNNISVLKKLENRLWKILFSKMK